MIRLPVSSLQLLLLLVLSAGAAAAGTVEIVTQAGVDVYWEGVHLATTDAGGLLTVEDVPPGPFELTLSKEGFEELATRVSVGEGTTRLSRELRPILAAAPLAPPAETPPAEPTPHSGAPGGRPSGQSSRQPSTSQAPSVATPDPPTLSREPVAAAPAVRVSRGAWLAGIVILGLVAALLRLWRSAGAAAPPAPGTAGRKPARRVTRAPSVPKGGRGFLSELRQRERALDELVDVGSLEGRGAEVPEPEVVDVAWKEID